MTTPEDMRATHPSFPVRVNKHDRTVTPESDPAEYEAMIAERVAWENEATAAATAAAQDATRLDQLLADIETGTNAQAIAAMRIVVPRLVRSVLRRRG